MDPADSPALKNFFLVEECGGISCSCRRQASAFTVPATTQQRALVRVVAVTIGMYVCMYVCRWAANAAVPALEVPMVATNSFPCMGSQRKMLPACGQERVSIHQTVVGRLWHRRYDLTEVLVGRALLLRVEHGHVTLRRPPHAAPPEKIPVSREEVPATRQREGERV